MGGAAGYKSGYAAGYRREDEDMPYIAALQLKLTSATHAMENLRGEIENL